MISHRYNGTLGPIDIVWEDIGSSDIEVQIDAAYTDLTVQESYDAIREAEATEIGMAYPILAKGSGKETLSPEVSTGITVQFLDNVFLRSKKTDGLFRFYGGNGIKENGDAPFVDNHDITQINITQAAGVIISTSGGGSSAVDIASAVWAHNPRTLTSFGTLVADVWNALISGFITSGSIGKLLKDNVDDKISTKATPTDVKAKMVEAINTDTYADPGVLSTNIPASLSINNKINWIFARLFRKKTFDKDTGAHILYNNSNTAISKSVATDDGTTTQETQAGAP
jgi:hypothetical protein